MVKMLNFTINSDDLILEYSPSWGNADQYINTITNEGVITIQKAFSFKKNDLVCTNNNYQGFDDALSNYTIEGESPSGTAIVFDSENNSDGSFMELRLGTLDAIESDYYKIRADILGLKYDLLLYKNMEFSRNTFIASRGISIFRRIDALIDEPIVIGGSKENAISTHSFSELLNRFPTTTEVNHYAATRITVILKKYFNTMTDSQVKLDNYLNNKKYIKRGYDLALMLLKDKKLENNVLYSLPEKFCPKYRLSKLI